MHHGTFIFKCWIPHVEETAGFPSHQISQHPTVLAVILVQVCAADRPREQGRCCSSEFAPVCVVGRVADALCCINRGMC